MQFGEEDLRAAFQRFERSGTGHIDKVMLCLPSAGQGPGAHVTPKRLAAIAPGCNCWLWPLCLAGPGCASESTM